MEIVSRFVQPDATAFLNGDTRAELVDDQVGQFLELSIIDFAGIIGTARLSYDVFDMPPLIPLGGFEDPFGEIVDLEIGRLLQPDLQRMPTPTDGVWVLGMREFQNVNNVDNDLYFEVFAQLYDLSSRPVGDLNIAGLAGDFSLSSEVSSPPQMSVAVSPNGTLVAAFGGGGDLIVNPVVVFAVDRNGQEVFSTESSAFGDVMDVSIFDLNGEDAIRITTSVRDPVDSTGSLIEQVSAFSLRDGSVMLPPTYIDPDNPDRRIGTLGRDVIDGDENDNVIDALDGSDAVRARGGNDVVDGGDGNDTTSASGGDDVVNGGEGNDDLGGGAGRDTIDAGAGDDSVGGGEGDDSILGGDGNDFLAGGGRNDVIDGGLGDDTINGGDGDDVMTGGEGADVFVFNFFKDGDEDVITDYEDGIDSFLIRIVNPDTGEANISNGGNGLQGFVDALNITDTAAGAQMDIGGHLVTVEGMAAADLTLDDFSFI